MNLLESLTYSARWAENTISDIASRVLDHDGLLDRAARAGVRVHIGYDWFPDNRVRRVTVRILQHSDESDITLGSAERDENQPFREDLLELFEQVRRQLMLTL